MDFEAFLKTKKIDSQAFRAKDFERWKAWKNLFEQMHPESFVAQKKFLINETRRKYILKED